MTTWETVGGIEIDSGNCAFADPATLEPGFTLRYRAGALAHDGPVDGLSLVVCGTGMDLGVPLEVSRDGDDEVIAARLCFVTDVDELDETGQGCWEPLGTLDIASGTCVACDPYCLGSADCYQFEFAVRPGRWSVERFSSGGDVLGVRATRSQERTPA